MYPIILEKLPNTLRLIIIRNNNENNWNFTKILDLINVELKAREACVVPSHTAAGKRVRMILGLAVHPILHIQVHP